MNRRGQDRMIFEQLVSFLDKGKTQATFPGQLMLEIGKFFLGTPYMDGTLETKKAESLIINLSEFDCVTLVENVVALAGCLKSRKRSFKDFGKYLQKVRYREGRLQGYSSRLHYFSEWIHDNQKKGVLRDVTAEIGGRPLRKTVTFMTTHPDLFPPLRDAVNLREMRSIERTISRRSQFFISKKALRRLEDRILDGDLMAITTSKESLDVQHVGLAARVRHRIHLLHASSTEGKVVLSPKTLYRYLMQSRTRSGIMVARVVAKTMK